jgi:hypothetical protein
MAVATFEERKRDELQAKIDGFLLEMGDWQGLAARKHPLEKHHTQVENLTELLAAVAEEVSTNLRETEDLRSEWTHLERQVLALHTAWGFYRDKWALRRIDGFQQYLILADEFAWACYEPAMKAVEKVEGQARARRVPPLVFLGPVHGPWSLARGDSGQEDVDDELVNNTVVAELVRQLPLSVVALPWHQLSHLPEAIVLGHEVGHLVLVDFVGLDAVEKVIDDALSEKGVKRDERKKWRLWTEEAFADVYGALSGGPAFAQTLGDVLISRDVTREPGDEYYPPPILRMSVVAGALEQALSSEAAEQLMASWQDDGVDVAGAPGHSAAMEVGRALVAGQYAALGGSLDSVIDPGSLVDLAGTSTKLLNRMKMTIEIRPLLAATVTAFRTKPKSFANPKVRENILATAVNGRERGFRGAGSPTGTPAQAQVRKAEKADNAEFDKLWQVLSKA